MVIRNKH